MSTAVRSRPQTGAPVDQKTDILVIFGISGDLARVIEPPNIPHNG